MPASAGRAFSCARALCVVLGVAFAAVSSLGASSVSAQAWLHGQGRALGQGWLADRNLTTGPGIRFGDFELHPGIGVEAGYDSNVYYADARANGSGILRVTPSLYLSTITQERTQEENEGATSPSLPGATGRVGISGSYYHYFASPVADNAEADAFFDIQINPQRPFSVVLNGAFSRFIRPFSDSTMSVSFARNNVHGGIGFIASSTGGILQGRLAYQLGYDFFDEQAFKFGNSLSHTVASSAAWRFLPQTSLTWDMNLDVQGFTESRMDSPLLLTDRTRLQTRIGLNGAFTAQFAASIMVGYGAGFQQDPRVADYDSLVMNAEGRWTASESVRVIFGYDRTFSPSFAGNFYRYDRGYLGLQLMVGGAFLLGVDASAGALDFGPVLNGSGGAAGTTTQRTDIRVVGTVFGEYRFTNWLALNSTIRYTGQFTDFQFMNVSAGATLLDPAGFNKFEAWLGVRAFY